MEESPPGSKIAETIYRTLQKQILQGELPAGARLPGERELAATFNTNRNTLREAVRRLEQARLVSVRHGQGVTISDFRRTGTMELLPPFLEAASDIGEIHHLIEDILPARLLVIEFASRMAVRRANRADCQRLEDVTALLISAFERADPVVIARGFQRWLDALIDASHSVSIRWIANPFLDAYRELLEQYPSLWVLDPTFPEHLRDFLSALQDGNEERGVEVLRGYYNRIDGELLDALEGLIEIAQKAKDL